MTEKTLAKGISSLGIRTVTGIPDSTLKVFCDYMQNAPEFEHYTCPNEGSAVGIAIGSYLATNRPACVYMQNSGLGNIVNPYTSLVHHDVYGIPVLFVIGWRGDNSGRDEPQHKFMGRVTLPLLESMDIPYEVINRNTNEAELQKVLEKAADFLAAKRTFAIVVQRGTFEEHSVSTVANSFSLTQEDAILGILQCTSADDVIVSTTGKISRELYEKLEADSSRKGEAFLTVGGMGYASSIAYGIACNAPTKRVYCIDGDGAVLMHMGNLATIGAKAPKNLFHICLNNEAYESVGGMPTGVKQYYSIARECGYRISVFADSNEAFLTNLSKLRNETGPIFLEVGIKNSSRGDLGRPKESAHENMKMFQAYHWKKD